MGVLRSVASRETWLSYVWITCALAAGAWLRFFELGKHALWLDEATTAAFAARPFEAMLFAEAQHPPLYNLMQWLWVRGFSGSDACVRVLSAVFGTLTIWAIWLLARRLTRPLGIPSEAKDPAPVLSSFELRASIYAAWLAALSPFLIFFAQENRSYSLLILLAVLSTWAFARWMQEMRGLWLYAALGAAMLYTHYFGTFILLAHEIVFWRTAFQSPIANRKSQILRWVSARSVVLIAFWPWVVWVAISLTPQARDWVGSPLPRIPYAIIRYLLGYGVVARDLRTTSLEEILRLEAPYVLPIFLLLLWLVWGGWRALVTPASSRLLARAEDATGSMPAFPVRWLMGGVLLLPFVILLPISPWMRLIHERYLSFQAPFVLLLAALGLASLRPRAQLVAGGATLASLAFLLVAHFGAPGHFLGYELRFMKEDWRGAAAFVREAQPDVVIVAPHYICLPLDRYLPERPGPRHIRMPDRFTDAPLISPPAQRIALVIAREGPPQADLRQKMDAQFRRIADRSFWSQNPIHVLVYERK